MVENDQPKQKQHKWYIVVLALLLAVYSCNKEERKLKKYTKKLCTTRTWNGYRSYWTKASQKSDSTLFVDSSMSITKLNDNQVGFLGETYSGTGLLVDQNAEIVLTFNRDYTGYESGFTTSFIKYYYEKDSVWYVYSYNRSSSNDVIQLFSK